MCPQDSADQTNAQRGEVEPQAVLPSLRARFLLAISLLASALAQAATPALKWSDEFNQAENTGPAPARWSFDLGAGGWGNNELQTYTDARDTSFVVADPAATDGKALAIRARRTDAGGYHSARIKTQGKFATTYGRIEARMKLTSGRGLWPACWMLGESIAAIGWPACGEIDIVEQVGHEPGRLHGTLHGPGYAGTGGVTASITLPGGASFAAAYHVFAVEWWPQKIEWSLDGRVYASRTPAQLPAGARWVFDTPFFLLFNLAVGGDWPGHPDAATVFPATIFIDYVRVYGLPPAPPPKLAAHAAAREVQLTWLAPTETFGAPLTGYRLERATNAAFTENLQSFAIGPEPPFTDRHLAPGATYFYRLAAITAGGVSDPSIAAQATTAAAPRLDR